MQKYGIMIMSGFAALWFVWGLSALPSFNGVWLLVPFAVSGAMIGLALRIPVAASQAERRDVGRIVGWASGIEFVAIFAANTALGMTGHAGLAVCATLAIVGLHFLPLAYFLQVRNYYLAGSALVALAAYGLTIGGDTKRLLVLGVGAAVLLWITCLAAFARKPRGGMVAA
jgi:hypothetical protein